ncbi:MAG: hypothetical protein IPN33_12125 [Saprospiraceae bacterium]|nr:hypothetical protein [Saprospiraceae bacterium]
MKSLFQFTTMSHKSVMMPLLAIALLMGACKKEDNTPEETVNDEEIAAIVEGALIEDTEGLAQEASDAVYIADQYTTKTLGPCGQTFDSTIVRSYNSAAISASYNATLSWTVNCNNLMIPQSVDFASTALGQWETPRMSSDDNANSSWNIGNLTTGSTYTLDGSYTRNGSQTSKVRDQNVFTSTLIITSDALNVNKTTRHIESGTASFTLSGSGTGGNNFFHQGSLQFNGNGEVVITVNGHTHTVDLY